MQVTQEEFQAATLLLRVISRLISKEEQQATSPAWEQWATEQLDAELAGNLLLAAAARGNAKAVEDLDAIKPAAVTEAVSGNTLAAAVEHRQSVLLKALCKHSGACSDIQRGTAGGFTAAGIA
jgi:hypothetical protein